MKTLLLILVLLISSVSLSAQDYQCVKNDVTMMFESDYGYHAIAIDSVVNQNGFDSWYNFPVIGPGEEFWCLSGNWPSWIGRKIDIYPNGDHIFYNHQDQPILIKTAAGIGESWTCYVFEDNRYIETTVDNIVQMNFLGLTDSVKIFSFQVKDENGNNLSHDLNSKQLRVSKHYGMVKALTFKNFPDLTDWNTWYTVEEFTLAGLSDPMVGVQNLTIEDIFSFEVGDEFHVHEYYFAMGDNTHWYQILTLVDKEWIVDELHLSFDRCAQKRFINMMSGIDTAYNYQDTVNQIISQATYGFGGLNSAPQRYFASEDSVYKEYTWYNQELNFAFNRMSKRLVDGYYSSFPHECIQEIITKNKYYQNEYFVQGLGGPFWQYDNTWGSKRELVYYNAGGEEWGEPYNCDSLLTVIHQRNPDYNSISIAPNPMKESTRVSFQNKDQQPVTLSLYNSVGRKVYETTTTGNEIIFERNKLSEGIYFVRLSQKGSVNTHSEKLIIR